MVKILVADDFALIREGLKKLLADEPELSIVAETDHGGNVLRLIEKHEVNMVLLDISMPGISGLDVLKDLKKHYPKLPVLILSMHQEKDYAMRSLKLGASGYLRKTAPLSELLIAIHRIKTGGKYIPFLLAEQMADWFAGNHSGDNIHTKLSNREFDIMRQLATGCTLKQIAQTLSLTLSSVTTYRNRIFKKMEFTTNADLIRYCLEHELIA
jgi:two-component system, NarL family, invasion response regulator UvrY